MYLTFTMNLCYPAGVKNPIDPTLAELPCSLDEGFEERLVLEYNSKGDRIRPSSKKKLAVDQRTEDNVGPPERRYGGGIGVRSQGGNAKQGEGRDGECLEIYQAALQNVGDRANLKNFTQLTLDVTSVRSGQSG
jgi:hypothetical protein